MKKLSFLLFLTLQMGMTQAQEKLVALSFDDDSPMSQLSADSIRYEVKTTSSLVKKYVGKSPVFFRPPYINVNQTMYDNICLGFICGEGCEDWIS